ncbi:hypothetical protein SAMN05660463_01130 [Pseudomonas sp. URIL14HWK12:I9]|nr:hypothetical protein F474_02142 [Pseudomonas sp. URIL14HWK12:I12]PVZ24741.1 hypothetical protein F470_01797 [Pseudomonas sp. URIL14HWK12:I10]PVZ34587.1 hypothetical protein F472_02143 [Pseudomonas sp. URIL14HWK12:I11]SNZ08733.1 hypothetical protein SAMN05660463_01130 [Pseudomonas sp. URIL14HWK12:I9]
MWVILRSKELGVEIEGKRWHVAIFLTIVMSIATGIGNVCSSYLLLSVKNEEEVRRAEIARRARGAEMHCDKLREAASLAAEIEFSADRGYPNIVSISDLLAGETFEQHQKVPREVILDEQLAYEKRASALVPMLTEEEAKVLNRVTLHHYVVTSLRTSKVPPELRASPREGGFNANDELQAIRDGGALLAAIYRQSCTEAR